jgi:hypothetical protein
MKDDNMKEIENGKAVIKETNEKTKEKCGIIMPISELDGCSEQHWIDVKKILIEAIEATDFEANLVSDSDDIGIIQKRIIQNIYDNPIIICDVSGKNPNVMFELGLRLAFDKPTIIVKDDKTSYSFDTSPIEHLTYPRDLRYNKIIDFKKDLSEKINGTHEKAKKDKDFSTFLKHFGKFTVAKVETTEVSKDEFVLEELKEIRYAIKELTRKQNNSSKFSFYKEDDNDIEPFFDEKECKNNLRKLVSKIINSTNLNKIKNKELFIKEILSRKNELPDCFNAKKGKCMDFLNDILLEYNIVK